MKPKVKATFDAKTLLAAVGQGSAIPGCSERESPMKADRPRAIDQYVHFFGDGAGTRPEALDTPARPVREPPGVERSDLVAGDDNPRP